MLAKGGRKRRLCYSWAAWRRAQDGPSQPSHRQVLVLRLCAYLAECRRHIQRPRPTR